MYTYVTHAFYVQAVLKDILDLVPDNLYNMTITK